VIRRSIVCIYERAKYIDYVYEEGVWVEDKSNKPNEEKEGVNKKGETTWKASFRNHQSGRQGVGRIEC
jgi:hypothetical protein